MAPRIRTRRETVAAAQARLALAESWTEPAALAEGPESLTAAARAIDVGAANRAVRKARKRAEVDWQTQAWHHYNRCGELQFAATWMANSLSRIRLYAAEVGEDGRPGKPTENKVAKKIAAGLFGGPGQAAETMAALGVHLVVPGDCYVVCEGRPGQAADDWYVISTSELVRKDGTLGVDRGNGWRPLDEKSTVLVRVWNPHPQRYEEATSATRAVLPVLRELEKLDQHVHATLESRLPAGILFVPDSIDFRSPDPEHAAAVGEFGGLMTMLVEAMMSAVEDHESPAALAPILAKVPVEAMGKIEHISFGGDLIASVETMRLACIRRLALGLDMPPEQLLGMGDSSHWSSWQIEESGVKVHVEPKAIRISTALTEAYFRPALRAAGIANPEDYILWYDVTELILRPNRADIAKELHAANALSLDVLMREAGFDPETDKPSDDEYRRRILEELLWKQPIFAKPILDALGITGVDLPEMMPYTRGDEITPEGPRKPDVELPGKKGSTDPAKGDAPKDDAPTGQDSPAQTGRGRTAPDRQPAKDGPKAERAAALLAAGLDPDPDPYLLAREIAVETLVSRGLEYANKKLLTRGRRGTFDGDIRRFYLDGGIVVQRDQLARLLDGAWTYLAELADSVGLDAASLEAKLTDHVGGLLLTGQEHSRRYSRTIAAHCLAADQPALAA